MSLILERGTQPEGLMVKTGLLSEGAVLLGGYRISMEDFLIAAHYVLTNTNLTGDDDHRLQFVECVRSMNVVKGYATIVGKRKLKTKRLHTKIQPVLDKET